MFAVIKTGGKQYKVAANDEITVMLLQGEAGAKITFGEVLALYDGQAHHIGAPRVEGASVTAEIVEQARGPKVYAFKKRRRKNSKRKRGHKQDLTIVKILEIQGAGKSSSTASAALMSAEGDKHLAAEKAARAAGIDTAKFQKLEKAFGTADDLEWIHGIGPGIAKKLHGVGVYHFWQVAAMSAEDIAAIEHEVGFHGRAERDHWKAQAMDLMAGNPPKPKAHGHADHAEG
ncbi:MAG: 50S ribosomal protein L21 [Pseudomonadota bacterium]|nr:50S ribosomal protein L21 [Pseudomonadota bacterium]